MTHSFEIPQIPGYSISKLLGRGSTAAVYEATRKSDGLVVALKILETKLPRLEQEALTLQKLRHPSIVRFYGNFVQDQNTVLVLESIQGNTLREWMNSNSVILIEPRLQILADLAQAMAFAHDEGIIHRDLKPENIMLTHQGHLKLTDFGLAKDQNLTLIATQPGLLMGSLAYISPEQLNDGNSSKASDVFSFGIIALELLNGKHPFPHSDAKSLLKALFEEDKTGLTLPPSASIPPYLAAILKQCLNYSPSDRPTSFWEIYSSLTAAIHESGMRSMTRNLLSSQPSLRTYFEFKQKKLRSVIESELASECPRRKILFDSINEWSRYFPDSPETSQFLSQLRTQEKPKQQILNRKAAAVITTLIATACCLSLLFFYSRTHIREHKVLPTIASATPQETSFTPAMDSTPVQAKPSFKSAMSPLPTSGKLRMVVAQDTRVFIDGKRYGRESLKSLELPIGEHLLLMERDGFLPIERSISIKAGATTRVNALAGDL